MPEIEVRRMLPAELACVADLYVRSITGLLHCILKPEQVRADDEYRGYFTNVRRRAAAVVVGREAVREAE